LTNGSEFGSNISDLKAISLHTRTGKLFRPNRELNRAISEVFVRIREFRAGCHFRPPGLGSCSGIGPDLVGRQQATGHGVRRRLADSHRAAALVEACCVRVGEDHRPLGRRGCGYRSRTPTRSPTQLAARRSRQKGAVGRRATKWSVAVL